MELKNAGAIKIRKLCPSDLPTIVEILQNLLPNHPRYKDLTTSKIKNIYLRFKFEKWANRIEQCVRWGSLKFLFTNVCDRVSFVAEESDNLVGVAEAYPITTNDTWLIDAITVLPNYRRRGVGQQLMKELMNFIKTKGGKKMQLYVQPDNVSAMKFYTKLGFTITVQPIFMTMDLQKRMKEKLV